MKRTIVNWIFQILPVSRCFLLRRWLLSALGLRVAADVKVCGLGRVFGRGMLDIDSGTWVSLGVVFFTHPDARISIGSNCDIGPYTNFVTGTHEIGPKSRRAGIGYAESIHIGANSWIGSNCLILPGANIGMGSIVAGGSVVRKGNYLENSLIAGNPCRIVKSLDD